MQLFNHNNKDKLKELLHLGNVHDAQLKSVNYNVSEERLELELHNPFTAEEIVVVFKNIDIILATNSRWPTDRDTAMGLYLEENFTPLNNLPQNNCEYDKDSLCMMFEFFGGELHIVSKEVSIEITELRKKACGHKTPAYLSQGGDEQMDELSKIYEMLDWNKPCDVQSEGRSLASKMEDLNVLIQPVWGKTVNKNVWDNCSLVLSSKTDEELIPYIPKLLEWLQDMNWPGSVQIYKRLLSFKDRELLKKAINESLEEAEKQNDSIWGFYLKQLLTVYLAEENRLIDKE